MSNYAYMGKGVVTLQEGAGAPVDIGNVSSLAFSINENTINLPNYRTPGGGSYASVKRIDTVEVSMTLHDLSPSNLAMVLFGTATSASSVATIEALTTGAKEFKLVFAGVNEAATGRTVTVTIHRLKIGAAQGLDFIGDDFAAMEVTGEVLLDSSITDPGLSQFFKVEMTEA